MHARIMRTHDAHATRTRMTRARGGGGARDARRAIPIIITSHSVFFTIRAVRAEVRVGESR